MADEEQILFSVTINQDKAIKESADLERKIIDVKKQLDSLNEATKNNTGAQKAAAETNRKLTEQLKNLKSQQGEVNKEIQAANKVAATNANTIEGMRARVIQLNMEWKKTDIGSERFKQLATELRKSTDELKKQEAAVGITSRNVGNYVKDINVAGINVNALSEGIKKSREAFTVATSSTKAFSTALAATGIGLIVIGVGLLVGALMKLEPVAETIEALMKGIGGAIDALVGGVGKFIGNLMSGKGVIDSWNDSMSGMTDRMKESAETAYELARAQEALKDSARETSVENAELEASISKLLLQARDRTKSEKERIELLDQASAKERERFQNQKALSDEALRIAQAEFDQAKKNGTLNDDIEDRLAEAKIKVIELTSESADLEEKIAIRRNAINDKAEADAEKRAQKEEQRQAKAAEQAEKYAQLRKELETSLAVSYGDQITAIQKKAEEYRKAGAEEVDIAEWVRIQESEINKKRSDDYTKSISQRVGSIQKESQNEITALTAKYNEQAVLAQGNAIALAEIERQKQAEIAAITEESIANQIATLQATLTDAQATNENGAGLGIANTILSPEDKARLEEDLASLTLQLSEFHKSQAEQEQATTETQITAQNKLQDTRINNAAQTVGTLKSMFKEGSKLAKAAFLAEKGIALSSAIINGVRAVQAALANPPGPPFSVPQAVAAGAMAAVNVASIIGTTVTGFARGGQIPEGGGMIRGESHANGGVKFAMGDRIGEADGKKGEAYIVNTRHDPSLKAMASAINVMGGGRRFDSGGVVKFADGGLSGRINSMPVFNQLSNTDNLIAALQDIQVIATIEDINAGLSNKMRIEERANV